MGACKSSELKAEKEKKKRAAKSRSITQYVGAALTGDWDSDDESEPGDNYQPGESPDVSDDDSDVSSVEEAEERLRSRSTTSSNTPFKEFEWMENLPQSPDQISRANKKGFSKKSWITPNSSTDNLAALESLESIALHADLADDMKDEAGTDSAADITAEVAGAGTDTTAAAKAAAAKRKSKVLNTQQSTYRKWTDNEKSPMRFISFNNFRFNMKECKPRHEIPRCPEDQSLLVDLNEDPTFDRSKCLIIFISHTYLAGFDGKKGNGEGAEVVSQSHAENWRKYPHPDNRNNDKFELLVRGIDFLFKTMAGDMDNCYLWLDYSVLNQNNNPIKELEAIGGLEAVMSMCDCIFTPVVDLEFDKWHYPEQTHTNLGHRLVNYASEAFSGPNQYTAYMQRAWCRLELLYAGYLPCWKTGDKRYDDARHNRMSGGLYVAAKHGLRAHFLYGTKEDQSGMGLIKLPPMPRGYAQKMNPLEGAVTNSEDRAAVERQWKKLVCNDEDFTEYYLGNRNAEGQKHGIGTFTYEDGSTYEGGWENDKRHGEACVFTTPTGETISGDWENDVIEGYATHESLDGDSYYGEFNDKIQKHGTGRINYADGDVYEGCFRSGMRHHKGRMTFKEGDQFVGYFRHNQMNGFGTWTYCGGGSFQGYYKNDRRHGEGTFSSSEGNAFEGTYVHGKKHGKGTQTYMDGTILEGDWVAGRMEGEAVYTHPDGRLRTVFYKEGRFIEENKSNPGSRSGSGTNTPVRMNSLDIGLSSPPGTLIKQSTAHF